MLPQADRITHTLFCFGAFLLWYAITLFVSLFPDYALLAADGLLMPVMCILEFAALVPLYRWYCKRHHDIPLGKIPLKIAGLFSLLMLLLIAAQTLYVRQEGWIAQQFVTMNSGATLAFILAIVFLAPVFEEILFRGFILQGIVQWAPRQRFACSLLTSIIFAAMHTQYAHPQTLLALTLFSLLLCYARFISVGLRLPILLHVLYNLIGVSPWLITLLSA